MKNKSLETEHGRIVFLDYLRAVACLLVVFGHTYLMGFNGSGEITPWLPNVTKLIFGPDAVQRNIFTPPLLFVGIHAGINVGILGVSIFFLISGFVILRTVEREPTVQFVVRRVFRILPVNAVAVCFAAAVTALYCSAMGIASPNSWASALSSIFLANGFLHYLDTIPVLWSLEVEIFFYALMALLARRRHLGFSALLRTAFACMTFTIAANAPAAREWIAPGVLAIATHLSFITLQITFLLVGSMIYRTAAGGLTPRGLIYVVVAVGIFAGTRWIYLLEVGVDGGGVDLANGFWALGLFTLALCSGMHWNWIKPLKWIGDISYPLYLVHIPLAWICLASLAAIGCGMVSAGIVTGLAIVFVAWAVHIMIESPINKFAKQLVKTRTYRTFAFADLPREPNSHDEAGSRQSAGAE